MSSPKTRQRKQARERASELAKIASNAANNLVQFIQANEVQCMDAPEASFGLELDYIEEFANLTEKLSKSLEN